MVWIEKVHGKIPVALTIAGSDSGGGAGIQADLKTFAAIGIHGTSAITSITAQNTLDVLGVQDVDPEIIVKQIRAVVEDIGVDAAKTGMLHTSQIIDAVVDEVSTYDFPLVVDPVMIAKSGAHLLKEEAMDALTKKLLPRARVVTPNRFEAEKLAGMEICSVEEAKRAAKRISAYGPKAVVVKGGHLPGIKDSTDVVYYNEEFKIYRSSILQTKNSHGTGCSFAAAIAGYLAKGLKPLKAVERAKALVHRAIKHGLAVGNGHGPVNPLAELYVESERYSMIVELEKALKYLNSNPKVHEFVPEVRMNLVYALPDAMEIGEVASFPGRITFNGESLTVTSRPRFGASKHTAKTTLTLMKRFPHLRSALNLKYDQTLVETAKKIGLRVTSYDRKLEPEEVKRLEGESIPWGVEIALEKIGVEPDLIYHLGDVGKEPMITVIGRRPIEVANKTLEIIMGKP